MSDWPQIEGFPAREEIPAGRKLNLGCGNMILPRDHGWVNADRTPAPGVDMRWDFWRLPWPLRDEQFDYVLMCHLAEHIPHDIWAYPGAPRIREEGWFAVFREVHRILRPRGQVCVISPYGQSWGALQDPTHTRSIVPTTFAYFWDQDTPDYRVGYRFRTLRCDLIGPPGTLPANADEHTVKLISTQLWNVARSIVAVLEKA